MIWNGKQVKGVQVLIGRQAGTEPGRYMVVYLCNYRCGDTQLDAAVPEFGKYPCMVASTSWDYLTANFRPVSYRKLSEVDRQRLGRWVA